MATGGEKGRSGGDFYAVLGLKKECSEAELRNAYKKLALRWHPDRCTKSEFVEEAKEKFQAIQEAYSVLSDSNKRFLYDVGVYDSDDDDENGMGDFLGEMAQMMSQTKPSDKGQESFEELQQLFVEMFQADLDVGFGGPHASNGYNRFGAASLDQSFCNGNNSGAKRGSSAMSSGRAGLAEFNSGSSSGFCFGSNDPGQSSKGSKRRNGPKQKVSSKHDVSSRDAGISAS